ncbi:hypothetical protein LCGC14_0901020 [marine sediment metagenome]|uniref:Uncharacterized protein n=1 Tax=marine sediment metagenome TaxID=412755 RepID=A0A0F9S3C5_9ZZZZ
MSNEVFKNDTAITLVWNAVLGADRYQLQVSVNELDFSGALEQDDDTLVNPTKAFTDGGAGNKKRFWRWRYSTDGGATWREWSEVGSYWLNTSASGDISVAVNKWIVFDENDLVDLYQFQTFPVFKIIDQSLEHIRTRNRKFELLSEYVTSKAEIVLSFEDLKFVLHEQMRAFKRFNIEIKTFFLSTVINNGVDDVPNIWKVQFDDNPDFEMLVPTRQDLWAGEQTFIEV